MDGARVVLAQKEYELLLELAREPERVFTKEELLRDVWGFRSHGAHADARLARVAPAPQAARGRSGAELVVNVWGVGYRLLGRDVADPGGPGYV